MHKSNSTSVQTKQQQKHIVLHI